MLKYVLGLLIVVCLVLVGFLLWTIRETLNIYSSLIQAIATVVLVVVTAFYAWTTREMQKIMREQQELIGRQIKLMEKQVICDIRIANASVYTHLANQMFRFDLSFDVYNKNCARGSITLPTLVLSYPDGSEETILQDVVNHSCPK